MLAVFLSFLRTGCYDRSSGFIDARTGYGGWWSLTSGGTIHSHSLDTHTTYMRPRSNWQRGWGFALRCVAR